MLNAIVENDGIVKSMDNVPPDEGLPPLEVILKTWVTPSQAATLHKRSVQRIHQLIQDKEIRAIKIGSGWMIDPDSVAAYFASLRKD